MTDYREVVLNPCPVVANDADHDTTVLVGYRRRGYTLDYNGTRDRWSLYKGGRFVKILGYSREEDSIIYKTLKAAHTCRLYNN